jgi:hypothetical protein
MTNRCFSSSQLYALRNEINVQMLIEKTLHIPCRVTKGCFRFRCPLCNGFDSAVNPKTNLARCFRCEKNFNTIDLVMLVRHERHNLKSLSGSNHQSGCRMKLKTPSGKSDSRPHPIGKILDDVLPPKHAGISENRFAESKSNKPMVARRITDEDRIVKLEQQLEYLNRQIKKIARDINVGLASK